MGHDAVMSAQHTYIASVVATYWFVSISMVYLNKFLMSNEAYSVPAPLFVTWFQCLITSIICWACGVAGQRWSNKGYGQVKQTEGNTSSASPGGNTGVDDGGAVEETKPNFWSQFPTQEYKIGTGQAVFPLSCVFVGMITFNNLCLKWVEVSFYNVARSLTIVFNVVLSMTMLGQHSSPKTLMCLGVVIIGFFVGSKGELDFSLRGTIAGVASSLFVSLNSIYTKKVLPVVDNDHWKLTFYNNVNATVMFLPLILVFEHQPLYTAFGKQFLSLLFWFAMFVAGFFGFAIGIVTVLQIKATSPLTHNISGTAKAALQSILAFYIWKNQPTFMGVLGIFTVLGGSLAYTIVKMQENAPAVIKKDSRLSTSQSKDSEDVELQKSNA